MVPVGQPTIKDMYREYQSAKFKTTPLKIGSYVKVIICDHDFCKICLSGDSTQCDIHMEQYKVPSAPMAVGKVEMIFQHIGIQANDNDRQVTLKVMVWMAQYKIELSQCRVC